MVIYGNTIANTAEQFDSVHDLILTAFRGEPEIPPDVRRILQREPPAFNALPVETEGTSATQPSQEPAPSQKKTSKRCRSPQGDDDALGDKAPSKARVRIAHNKVKPLAQLKFSCVFHKKFPHIYCTRTSIGGADKFYEPCSGTGWTEIRHLVKHYTEKHGRPQCLNCLEIFANTQALTTHQREAMCLPSWDRSTEEPIDPAVILRIKQACRDAKAESPWTKEEIRWFKICFILFPLSEPPNSPYVGQEAEIRLIRAIIDSLENRIQANGLNSPSSMDLRSIIDDLQMIIWRLGPALEEAELLQQQQQNSHYQVTLFDTGLNTDLNIDTMFDDPAVQLWSNRNIIADMEQ